MKKWFVILLGVLLVTASGCVRKTVLDDINTVTGIGYDYHSKTKVRGTLLIPVYQPQQISNQTLSTTLEVSRDVINELQHKSSEPLGRGSLEVLLFGDKMARKGTIGVLEMLQRDPRIGTRAQVAIVKGRTDKLLQGNYGTVGNGIYLSNLIRQNVEERDIPRTNLHSFLYAYYSNGSDPFLPYLQKEGNKVKVVGIALFKNDRMVHHIKNKDLFYFKILSARYKTGTHTTKMEGEYASIRNITTTRKFLIEGPKERPSITVDIRMKGVLYEFSHDVYNKKIRKQIEDAFEKDIAKNADRLIKHMQSHRIDPVGFGERAKSRYRNFDYKAFYRNYPDLDIKVKAKVTITQAGIVE